MKLEASADQQLNHQKDNKLRQSVIASYDDHYSDVGKLRDTESFYRWVLAHLLREKAAQAADLTVEPTGQPMLLDVACGEGLLVSAAADLALESYGVDFSSRGAQTAKKRLQRNVVSVADGEELPFHNGSFDYATNIGSLEHFFSPSRGLQEMQRVLKPGGLAALVLPNSYYLLDIIWHVWRSGYPVSHKQEIERFGTAGEWRDLISENGFDVLRTYKYTEPLQLVFHRILDRHDLLFR